MRIKRPPKGMPYIHCCLFDRECLQNHREYTMPLRLHLNFLIGNHGHPVYVSLWGERRHARWLRSLTWVDTNDET